jgi:hypothetical protein
MAIEPRTIFARIARMSMSGRERHHELLVDVDLALRVANKGFIFAPVTALLPCTAFGFLLLLR